MRNKRQTQTTNQEAPICLSDYELQPLMSPSEVLSKLNNVAQKYGDNRFRPVAKQVYYNLNLMKPGTTFSYQKFFRGEQLEIFIIVAFYYISTHYEYEFLNDFSAVRRTDWTLANLLLEKLRLKKVKESEESDK